MQKVSYKSLLILIILSQIASSISTVTLQTSTQNITIFSGNSYANNFIDNDEDLQCSNSKLYTYRQTPTQLQNNLPYQIRLNGITENTKISLATVYEIFNPSLSQEQCPGTTQTCQIMIKNNCPNPVGYFRYFDILNINIQGLQTISYYVICNSQFSISTFQAGLLLLLAIFIVVIILGSIYSKAWSYSGQGYNIDIRIIIPFNIILIVGGLITVFAPVALPYLGDILSWFFGTIGVMVCFNQCLFLLKSQRLSKTLITLKFISIRVIDIISFVIGLVFLFSWFFSNRNWIISDIISLSMILAVIKLLKFSSLKIAILQYCLAMGIQIIFLALLETIFKTNTNSFLLDNFNNPFQLQLPTINPVYGQKCSWFSVTVIMYPGILISYFRRFDTSRNTNIYTITSVTLLFGGAIIWMVLDVITPINLPFGIIAEPAMIGLVCLFAHNRKQIRILWDGKFYDAQFMHKQEVQLVEMASIQQGNSSGIKQVLFDGLKINQNQDSCIQPIFPEDTRPTNVKEDQI